MTKQACSVENCGKRMLAHGWCAMHYARQRKWGNLFVKPTKPPKVIKPCNVVNCSRPSVYKGLCEAHYQRLRINGDTNPDKPIGCVAGKWHPMWKGGEIKFHGRVLVWTPGHPYPNHNGAPYVYRYRLVVEKAIGRYLLPTELVHHKNGNKSDDRLENLEIMSRADHMRHHDPRQWRQRKVTQQEKEPTHGQD